MIEIARTNIRDPRATFVVCPASRMNHVMGSFDRVICNAALWQFPSLDEVFAAMRKCTHAGTRVVFNAPAERVTGESTPIHPFQVTLMEEINRALGEPFLATAAMVDRSVSPAKGHAFSFVRTDRFVYEGVQDETDGADGDPGHDRSLDSWAVGMNGGRPSSPAPEPGPIRNER